MKTIYYHHCFTRIHHLHIHLLLITNKTKSTGNQPNHWMGLYGWDTWFLMPNNRPSPTLTNTFGHRLRQSTTPPSVVTSVPFRTHYCHLDSVPPCHLQNHHWQNSVYLRSLINIQNRVNTHINLPIPKSSLVRSSNDWNQFQQKLKVQLKHSFQFLIYKPTTSSYSPLLTLSLLLSQYVCHHD